MIKIYNNVVRKFLVIFFLVKVVISYNFRYIEIIYYC